jgi:hypothetical protein
MIFLHRNEMRTLQQFLILLILTLNVGVTYGQMKVGTNPKVINPNSMLEIEATNKGLLLPRLALSSTTLATPLASHVAGVVVYNTATTGDVSPGIYVNIGTKWIKGMGAGGSASNSWYDVSTSATATSNTSNVYQMGSVGIGTKSTLSKLNISNTVYESKISLFDAGVNTNYFGFGVSAGALNYLAQNLGAHVFSVGGNNGENVANETFRVFDSGIKLSKAPVGTAGLDFMVLDSVDKLVKIVKANQVFNTLGSVGNGLSKVNNQVQLGGTLSANTTIDLAAKSLNFTNVGNLGVNVSDPTAVLDVNGSVRLRSLPGGSNNDNYVSIDPNGNLHTLIKTQPTGTLINQIQGDTEKNGTSGNIPDNVAIFTTYDGKWVGTLTLPPATDTNANTTKIIACKSTASVVVSTTNTSLSAALTLTTGTSAIFMSDGSKWRRIDN